MVHKKKRLKRLAAVRGHVKWTDPTLTHPYGLVRVLRAQSKGFNHSGFTEGGHCRHTTFVITKYADPDASFYFSNDVQSKSISETHILNVFYPQRIQSPRAQVWRVPPDGCSATLSNGERECALCLKRLYSDQYSSCTCYCIRLSINRWFLMYLLCRIYLQILRIKQHL